MVSIGCHLKCSTKGKKKKTYHRNDHQDIVGTKLANLDLGIHSQDDNNHCDGHGSPDTPDEGRADIRFHDD
jgi:hypothetical protein